MASIDINVANSNQANTNGLGGYSIATEDSTYLVSGTDVDAVIQYPSPPAYPLHNSFLDFGISGIPVGASITSASLILNVNTVAAYSSTTFYIYAGSQPEHGISVATTLFNNTDVTKLYGTTQNVNSTGALTITLGGSVLSDITNFVAGSGGTNRLCLAIKSDINAGDSFQFSGKGDAGNLPILRIGYVTPSNIALFATEVINMVDLAGFVLALTAIESFRR